MQLPLDVDIEEMCGAARELRDCLQAMTELCSGQGSVGPVLEVVVQVFDYVCSDIGIETVTGLLTSPCNSPNRSLQKEVFAEIDLCNKMATTRMSLGPLAASPEFPGFKCDVMKDLSSCAVLAVRTTCGNPAGDFGDAILEILFSSPQALKTLVQLDCPAPAEIAKKSEEVESYDVGRIVARALHLFNDID